MANHGRTARLLGREDPEPTAADLLDPVALEARLVEARARRAAALARRKSGEKPEATSRPPVAESDHAPRPRLAASAEAVPAFPAAPATSTAPAEPRRRGRDGMLAGVFFAGLLGGFALVFLAPASLRHQIAHLIAPESRVLSPQGSALSPAGDAPVAGDAVTSRVSLAADAAMPAFPARPDIVSDGGPLPQSVQPAPETEAAPMAVAESAPTGIAVPYLMNGLTLADTAGSGDAVQTPAPDAALQVPVPAVFGPVSRDVAWSGEAPDAGLPVPPRIGPAPALLAAAGGAQGAEAPPAASEAVRDPVPAPVFAASADATPARPEAGPSVPSPSRAPDDLAAATPTEFRGPVLVAAAPSRISTPQAMPAASSPDATPDPDAEPAALAAALSASERLAAANAGVAVSAARGLPVFADSGQVAPVSLRPWADDFAGGDKASILTDLVREADFELAAYWPTGELVAAAPVRKAAKRPVVTRRTTTKAAEASDQAVAKQVTRIILQRRVERMLRDLQ